MISPLLRVRRYPLTVAVGATLLLSPAAISASTALDNSLVSPWLWRSFPGILAVGMAAFVFASTLAPDHPKQLPARPWSVFFATWAALSVLNCLLTIASGNAITPSVIAGILLPAAFVRYQPLARDTRSAQLLYPAAFVVLSIIFSAADGLGLVRDQTWAESRITTALPWITDPLLLARWSMPWADANLAGTLALCAVIVSWNLYRGSMRIIVCGAASGLLVLTQSRYSLLVGLGVLGYVLLVQRLPSDRRTLRTLIALCIAVGLFAGVFTFDSSLNGRVDFFVHSLGLLEEAGPLGVCFATDCVISTSAHFSHSSILEPVVRFGVFLLIPLVVCVTSLFALIRIGRFRPTWALLVTGIAGGYWLMNFHVGISYWTVVSAVFVMAMASFCNPSSAVRECPSTKDGVRPEGG